MNLLKNKRFFSTRYGSEIFINQNGEILEGGFIVDRLEKLSAYAILSFFDDLVDQSRLLIK